uniref:Rab-GAP TBC domain-containing protein n=1 Tax=Piliocolobus tephrosceles TaxID=591936 RepID=A0A8C9I238_9PRIM
MGGPKHLCSSHQDKEGLCSRCSSFSWLLWMLNTGIFLELILRLWDIYLLEGEQMLMPITSTAFKFQRNKSTYAHGTSRSPPHRALKGTRGARPIPESLCPSLQELTASESSRGPLLLQTPPRVPGQQALSQGDKGISLPSRRTFCSTMAHKKFRLGVVAHACNPSNLRVRGGRFRFI